jgi:hypothetical protein
MPFAPCATGGYNERQRKAGISPCHITLQVPVTFKTTTPPPLLHRTTPAFGPGPNPDPTPLTPRGPISTAMPSMRGSSAAFSRALQIWGMLKPGAKRPLS